MKPIFILLIACWLPVFLHAQATQYQQRFSMAGKIKGKRQGYVYLDYPRQDGQWHTDSCAVQKRHFSFTGSINETTLATFRVGKQVSTDDNPNATRLFIEPHDMVVTVRYNHAKKMKVSGSLMQQQKDSLDKVLSHAVKSGHDIANKITNATAGFIISHPHSYVSVLQLNSYKTIWDVDTVVSLFNKLDSNVQNSYYGNDIKKIKDAINDNGEGKPAKNFEAVDINGVGIRLSDFKGKPVLLDFWASWCAPCREAIPHIKALYSQYHSKGLEIVGISCDDNMQAWKKAVGKDSTGIWYNVLGTYKNSEAAAYKPLVYIKDMYAIYGIPVVVIIDKNGIIAGRYTGDDEQTAKDIDEKLKEIMP